MDNLGEALPATTTPSPSGNQQPKSLLDDLDFLSTPAASIATPEPKEIVLPADKAQGMQIAGAFVRKDGRPCLDLTFTNLSAAPMSGLAIKFNVNRCVDLTFIYCLPCTAWHWDHHSLRFK